MAELTINHLIKIIIGIMVVIAAVIGVSMFFGVKVTDFFRGIPGFFDGECDPEKENCEEEEEEETEVRETCNEIIHVNGTEITKRPQAEGKIEGTITKTYNAENEKGRVRITGKGEGLKGKMKMIIKITRDEETIIKEEKEIELSLRSSESHEISFNANVQEEDVIEFEITKTECHRGRDCGFVKMQDFTITGCPDKCNENQDCEDDEYCSSSKKCRKQSCPEGNYCFEGNVYESEAKNHACEGKEIKTCECGCSNGVCVECPMQTETCTECYDFKYNGMELIVKTKTEINLKDGTNKYRRVNEGKAKNRKGEIDPECSNWFLDANDNGMQEIGELCMLWGCQGDRAVRNSFELNKNEKSGYEECKTTETISSLNERTKKLTFSHEGTEYRVISENMIIRRIDAEQFRKITTETTTTISEENIMFERKNEMPEITTLEASDPAEETMIKMLTLVEPEETENQKPCNTWFHDVNTNTEQDDGEEEMSDDWNCMADGKVDEFTKNPPDSCSNLEQKYLSKYKKYERSMMEAIKSEGLSELEHPRALMAAFISVESDWTEDANRSEKDYRNLKEGIHHTKRASWGLTQSLAFYDEINEQHYLCAGWPVEQDKFDDVLSRTIDYKTASAEARRRINHLPEDVDDSLKCGARVIKGKMGLYRFKNGGTYVCKDGFTGREVRYIGLKALARYYNGWPDNCNWGNKKYVEDIFYEERKGKYYDWVACISQLDREKRENGNH